MAKCACASKGVQECRRSRKLTSEIKWVHDEEGGGASETARCHVNTKPRPELLLLIVLGEDALEKVLEREVEGLSREVADHVREVSTPGGRQTSLGIF
jgi:hypothetical protein